MITTRINTDGLMSQLGEEVIESYDTGTGGKSIATIVDDLLAFQRKATKITKGTISVSGARALTVTNRTILAAFLQLQESVGGYLYVDNDRALQWLTTIGENKGQQIRYRKNLVGITRDIDYSGCCTKLYPVSSNESLSNILKTKVSVDKSSDASYGYLKLKETYACYKDWTALGAALPANVKVYEGEATYTYQWRSPINYNDEFGWWANEPAAYDENLVSYAYTGPPDHIWTQYLKLGVSSYPGAGTIQCVGIRIMWSNIGAGGMMFDVDVSPDGETWNTVVDNQSLGVADNNVWKEYACALQTVWCCRIRLFGYDENGHQYRLNEFDFNERLENNHEVTLNWHQGTNEHILRCAIGNYNPAANYLVSYQYANYLMAWDKIVDGDDIIAKVETNKYEAYVLSMLMAAILLLDELKEVPITYKIKAVDLAENEDFQFSFETLQLGSVVTVIDEDLGIDVSVRVVSLTHPDLLSPENIELELSTRVKDISDYLADLHKRFD